MLTLRQIEVIRAVMVTGTIGGASRLLNVSSPGISRVVKHAESVLRMKLFSRSQGRYLPTHAARDLFNQINAVYDRVEDLHHVIKNLERGAGSALKIASVPSIANVMVPRAIATTRAKFPDLMIEVDILKIEEAIDYLLLGKGEAVAVSHQYEHPMLTYEPLAEGRLLCVVPEGHALAGRDQVTPAEIARFPLIGIDPADPYGGIMAGIFVKHALAYEVKIRARFGSMVCAMVMNGLGIGVIDEFTLTGGNYPGLRGIPIAVPTRFQTYVAFRRDAPLSAYCEYFIASLRAHMEGAARDAPRAGRKPAAAAVKN